MSHYDEFREKTLDRKFKLGDLVKGKCRHVKIEFSLGEIVDVDFTSFFLPYRVEIKDKDQYRGACFWCREEDLTKIEDNIAYDTINHPKHYTSHPSGVEVIQITEHLNFCLGNVIKYVLRHTHKNGLEDLKKAQWYLNREIERLENANN